MATLFVTEYANWVNSPGGDVDRPLEPAITTQRLTLSGSETKTASLNVATKLVRIALDSGACNLLVGVAPTVTASTGMRFAQTVGELLGVPLQQTATVISAISTA